MSDINLDKVKNKTGKKYYTVKELKEHLDKRGLPKTGKKADLVKRLHDYELKRKLSSKSEIPTVKKYNESNYKSFKEIGEGYYGPVDKAIRKSDGKTVAIKRIYKEDDIRKIGTLPIEYVIMKDLDHPNIAKILDIEEDDEYFYIIMEFYPGGDLSYYVEDYKNGLSRQQVLHIARQLIDAVDYCHNHDVVHRDIKLENIFLIKKEKFPHVVLGDFGLSNLQPTNELLHDNLGSILYAAPELILSIPYYGTLADVWAIGVCLYLLFTGEYPFDSENNFELYKQITKREVFPDSETPGKEGKDCRHLIKWMLCKEPKNRPTIEEIQQSSCYLSN